MRFALILALLLFWTPVFADTFSSGGLIFNVANIYVPPYINQLTLDGSLVNNITNTTVTVTTIKWADDSGACQNCLAKGKFLILFSWEGNCKGSYFAYIRFPIAPFPPTVEPQLMGDTLILDLLSGSDCNGTLGPQKLTLTKTR